MSTPAHIRIECTTERWVAKWAAEAKAKERISFGVLMTTVDRDDVIVTSRDEGLLRQFHQFLTEHTTWRMTFEGAS